MEFRHLGLAEPIVRAVLRAGYSVPTPIQAQAIPLAIAGRDLLGCAQTGTGKTAAFALPIIHRFAAHHEGRPAARPHRPRALILAPTRELVAQIGESFREYGHGTAVQHATIFGGVNQNPQVRALRQGVDVIIATPGRLMDLMNQGHVDLGGIECLVLDEADRMLDMGFIPDIRKIVGRVPARRQTLLFSATMPSEIRRLAESILSNPTHLQVDPVSSTVRAIAQSVYYVQAPEKLRLLRDILRGEAAGRTLVFTRTKHGADKVAKDLNKNGLPAEAIHGNKSQNARSRALSAFKSNAPPVLVATDIASRGLDVDDISYVINFDMPIDAATYVHRIGRTARAGASGAALSFCDPHERHKLSDIERVTGAAITVRTDGTEAAADQHHAPRHGSSRRDGHSRHQGSSQGSGQPRQHGHWRRSAPSRHAPSRGRRGARSRSSSRRSVSP